MNFNKNYWDQPEEYNPTRFIKDNTFQKPKHFQPFSFGKRQCVGYKIVEYVTTYILASILDKYQVKCHEEMRKQPYGQLGLAPVPFYFTLKRLDAEEDNISRSLGWRLIDYTATDEVFHTYIYNTTLQDFDQW